MHPVAADALLNLLHPAWQGLIGACLLLVTVLGIGRLAHRGPARMTNGLLVAGLLIVGITVLGTLAVSCSGPSDRESAAERAPAYSPAGG